MTPINKVEGKKKTPKRKNNSPKEEIPLDLKK